MASVQKGRKAAPVRKREDGCVRVEPQAGDEKVKVTRSEHKRCRKWGEAPTQARSERRGWCG